MAFKTQGTQRDDRTAMPGRRDAKALLYAARVNRERGVQAVEGPKNGTHGAIVVAPGHREYVELDHRRSEAMENPVACYMISKGFLANQAAI